MEARRPFISSRHEEERRRGRQPTRDTFHKPEFDGSREKKFEKKGTRGECEAALQVRPLGADHQRRWQSRYQHHQHSHLYPSCLLGSIFFGPFLTESDAVSQRTLTNRRRGGGGGRCWLGMGGGFHTRTIVCAGRGKKKVGEATLHHFGMACCRQFCLLID